MTQSSVHPKRPQSPRACGERADRARAPLDPRPPAALLPGATTKVWSTVMRRSVSSGRRTHATMTRTRLVARSRLCQDDLPAQMEDPGMGAPAREVRGGEGAGLVDDEAPEATLAVLMSARSRKNHAAAPGVRGTRLDALEDPTMTLSSRFASVHTSWLSGTGRKSLTSTYRAGKEARMAPPKSSRSTKGSKAASGVEGDMGLAARASMTTRDGSGDALVTRRSSSPCPRSSPDRPSGHAWPIPDCISNVFFLQTENHRNAGKMAETKPTRCAEAPALLKSRSFATGVPSFLVAFTQQVRARAPPRPSRARRELCFRRARASESSRDVSRPRATVTAGARHRSGVLAKHRKRDALTRRIRPSLPSITGPNRTQCPRSVVPMVATSPPARVVT